MMTSMFIRVLETQHRRVIKLWNIPRESIDFRFHLRKKLPGTRVHVPVQHFQHPVCAKLYVVFIDRFRDTVSIDKQPVAPLNPSIIPIVGSCL